MAFNLVHYLKAGFPAVAVETFEEERFTKNVLSIKDTRVFSISALGGLFDCRENTVVDGKLTYPGAFKWIASAAQATGTERFVLIVLDFQHIIRNQVAYRALKDSFGACKEFGSMIVLVAPSWSLPAELSHDLPVLQFDLPSRSQLQKSLDVVSQGAGVVPEDIEALLDSAAGLASGEAENAFALSLVQDKKLLPSTVEREKMRLVKSGGLIDIIPPKPIESLGGLGGWKEYCFEEIVKNMRDPLLAVRGIIFCGVSGTGKSLAASVLGSILGLPILGIDIGRLKGGIVGQSEGNMGQVFKVAEAVAPCILRFDEIEKGVGGHASSAQTDGGTTLGMIGLLLQWLQDHNKPIITIMTCNDYSKLPPELTRAGRIDERFFVDLPSLSERVEIAKIHLKKYADLGGGIADHVAELTPEWSGAEIEQLIKSAARRSGRNITASVLIAAAKDIKPIAKVKGEEISKLRAWAKDTMRLANTVEIKAPATGRKVTV